MKKIVLILLCALSLFASCGKKEKGVMTIENKSSKTVYIEFAQNYSSEFLTLQPNDITSRSWERYFHCIINKPSTNILKRQQTKEKITIFDNDNLYSYKVINGVCPLKILDGNQYVQRNKIRENSILKFFRKENKEDDFVLMVDNKMTTQELTKHEIGKLLKSFTYKELKLS